MSDTQKPSDAPAYLSEGPDKKYLVRLHPDYVSVHREGDKLPVLIEKEILLAAASALSQWQQDEAEKAGDTNGQPSGA